MTETAENRYASGISNPQVWRRLFHLVAGSILPVAGIFLPWVVMIAGSGVLTLISLGLDLARFKTPLLNRIFLRWLAPLLKSDEDFKLTGATYMLIASFICFLVFDQTVAVTALLFLALGDPVAGLVGERMGGPRVFGKSPVGTAAFVVTSLAAAAVLASIGIVQFHWALVVGAVIAGLGEIAPLRVDDNLTIPISSGLFMNLVMVWL